MSRQGTAKDQRGTETAHKNYLRRLLPFPLSYLPTPNSLASQFFGLGTASLMKPGIGTILASSHHGHGFVVGPVVAVHGRFVQDTGPHHGSSGFGLDSNSIIVKIVKPGFSPLFHMIQVQKDGQNARSLNRIAIVGNVIVVCAIKFAFFV